jgi:hypothetical protein
VGIYRRARREVSRRPTAHDLLGVERAASKGRGEGRLPPHPPTSAGEETGATTCGRIGTGGRSRRAPELNSEAETRAQVALRTESAPETGAAVDSSPTVERRSDHNNAHNPDGTPGDEKRVLPGLCGCARRQAVRKHHFLVLWVGAARLGRRLPATRLCMGSRDQVECPGDENRWSVPKEDPLAGQRIDLSVVDPPEVVRLWHTGRSRAKASEDGDGVPRAAPPWAVNSASPRRSRRGRRPAARRHPRPRGRSTPLGAPPTVTRLPAASSIATVDPCERFHEPRRQ